MDNDGVSVVVPTLNRGGVLISCLQDLVRQRHRPLEVLLVDQSREVSGELVTLIGQHSTLIRHDRVGFRGLPEARNYGWQQATHEAIIFVDDDTRCGPDFVTEHLRALKLPGVGLVAGSVEGIRSKASSRVGQFRRWTATPLSGFDSEDEYDTDHAQGCNFSLWRWAAERAGGFDERLSSGAALYEDADFCLRLRRSGYRVYFNGKARLTHLAAPDGGCRVGDLATYGRALARNRCLLIRRHLVWFQIPVAILRLWLLVLSYTFHYREPRLIAACLQGAVEGLREGGGPPACGDYRGRKAVRQ